MSGRPVPCNRRPPQIGGTCVRGTVTGMLSYGRFVLGAILALSVLGAASLALFASLRIAQQSKIGPLQSSRSMPFDDRADWNQFNDPEGARRFEELTRKAELSNAAAELAQTRAAQQQEEPAADRATASDAPPAQEPTQPPAESAPPAPPTEAEVAPDAPPATVTQTTMTQPSEPAPAAEPAAPSTDEPPDTPRETGSVTPASVTAGSDNTNAADNTADEKTSDGKASATASWDEEPLMVDEDPAAGMDQSADGAGATPAAVTPVRRPIIPRIRAARERPPLREPIVRRVEREEQEPARAKPRAAKPAPRRVSQPRDPQGLGDDAGRQSQPYWQSGSQQYAPRQPAYRDPFGDYGARSP